MRYIIISLILITAIPLSQAQFVNNGGTVTVQAGATLRVETDFTNTSGTINNLGLIEVLGHFSNAAGSGTTLSGSGELRFIGTANSNLTTNGDALNHVEMAKTTSTGKLTLLDNTTINGNLEFTGTGNNKIEAGNFNLTLSATSVVSATTNHPTNGYVVTNGTGRFIKGITANGTKTFEIGDATNYTPLSCAVTGSTYSSATLGARAYTTGMQAKYTESTDYINREWQVAGTGISDYANVVSGTYVDGDITGTESLIKGSSYHTGDWRFNGSAGNAGTNTVTASTLTNDVKFSGQNFFGKANLKAYLQGPYSSGTMNTSLNSPVPANNLLELYALTSPYADAPASVTTGFFLANPNIVDWVRLEFRDPLAPSTSSNNKISAFIKNTGEIVWLDGTSLPRMKNVLATSVVVLSHRNHLPIRTVNAGLSLIEPTQHNFSSGLGQAYDDPLNTVNDAMANLGSGVFGLFRGNANGNLVINSTDITIITNQSNPIKSDVYNNSDVNLNGKVNSTDLSIATNQSNPIKNAHN